tara:strand:+ start:1862 stop:2173 length:312 start_codon:yes stop_codon:yes gene_type:complete
MIHITKKDHFVWLDVTKKCRSFISTSELNQTHELYAVSDDDVDFLIEDVNMVPRLIKNGNRICIEVGHLPNKYHPRKTWDGTSKKLIDGYWYVKLADIKLGNV